MKIKFILFILLTFTFSCEFKTNYIDFMNLTPPTVTGESYTTNTRPTWHWKAIDGVYKYRYSMDGNTWTETYNLFYTSEKVLSYNYSYTFFVQARYDDKWSESGIFTTFITLDIPNNYYTITFDSSGGSAVSDLSIEHGEAIPEPVPPVNSGYIFGGWFKDASYTEVWDFGNDVVTFNMTLYAKWDTYSYTISFDDQGADVLTVSPSTVVVSSPQTTIGAMPVAPEKTGQTFAGWFEGTGGTGNQITSSTVITGDMTIYAHWTTNPVYLVTFYDNIDSVIINTQNVVEGNLATEPSIPTKTGYTFDGWYKEAALTTVWDFATYTVTADVTIYAKWSVNTYTITFDVNGGSPAPADKNLAFGTPYTIGEGVTPVKMQDGIELLLKWKDTILNVYYEHGESIVVDKNLSLIAEWYVIGGEGPAGGLVFYDKGSVTDGWRYMEVASLTDEIVSQWATPHIMVGNTSTIAGSGRVNTSLIVDALVKAGQTTNRAAIYCDDYTNLSYTDWFLPSKDELHSVFTNLKSNGLGELNDAYYGSSSESTFDDAHGEWFGGAGNQYAIDKYSNMYTRPVRAFANASETYAVVYYPNEADGGSVPTDYYYYASGETAIVAGNVGSLARTGYTFAGWNTQANGLGTNYIGGNTFNVNSDTALYAKWAATASSDNDLASLTLSGITINPVFSAATTTYTASVDSSVTSTTVTVTLSDANATAEVQINGGSLESLTSSTPSSNLNLNALDGNNTIAIMITAEDFSVQTYTIAVSKTVRLTVNSLGNGSVSPSGVNEFTPGTNQSITATPDTGYKFSHWTGSGTAYLSDTNTANTTYDVPSFNYTIEANFIPDFAGGDGTSGNPFQVSNMEELNNVRNFLSSHFIQTANIDLASETNWTPIGNDTTKFTGSYDGGNYAISNLTRTLAMSEFGLFGETDSATISNVNLANVDITGSSRVGSLVGETNNATIIINCSATGNMIVTQTAGGLIGQQENTDGLSISGCWTDVTIETTSYCTLGGIIGKILNSSANIHESFALGSINITNKLSDQVGGLVGMATGTGTVSNCYAHGDVKGKTYIGGLVGYLSGYTLENSYSTGRVEYSVSGGGLIGNSSTVTNSHYDINTSNQFDTTKGTPNFTNKMLQQATFSGWDFATIWQIDENTSYPYLQWQGGTNIPTPGALDTDNQLADITVSTGGIEPPFSPGFFLYHTSTTLSTGAITVTPLVNNYLQVIQVSVDGSSHTFLPDDSAYNVPLTNQVTNLNIRVSAQNSITQVYDVDIFKGVLFVSQTNGTSGTGDIFDKLNNIQDAIPKIGAEYNEVRVDTSGTYTPNNGLNLENIGTQNAGVYIDKSDFKLSGGWNNDFTGPAGHSLLDAESILDHVMWIETGTSNVIVEGFEMTNGYSDGTGEHLYGGGLYIREGTGHAVKGCIIRDSISQYGGGMYLHHTDNSTFENLTVTNNQASNGGDGGAGAAYIYNATNLTFTGGTYSNNTAQFAGGLYTYGCSNIEFDSLIVDGNDAYDATSYGGGGGYYINQSDFVGITNGSIINNSAAFSGAGVFFKDTSVNSKNNFFGSVFIDGNSGAEYTVDRDSGLSDVDIGPISWGTNTTTLGNFPAPW